MAIGGGQGSTARGGGGGREETNFFFQLSCSSPSLHNLRIEAIMMAAKGASPRGQGASWLIKPRAVGRDDSKVRQRQKVRSSYIQGG